MIKVKRITKIGSVTIGKDLMRRLGLKVGQSMDVSVNGDEITLRKHVPACFICGGLDGIVRFKGFEICEECRGALKNAGI